MTRSQGTNLFQQLNMVFSGSMEESIYDTALNNLNSSSDMGKVAKNAKLMVLKKEERDHFKNDWLSGSWWPGNADAGAEFREKLIQAIKAAKKTRASITFVWLDNATDGRFRVHVNDKGNPVTVTVVSPPAKS